MKKSELITSKIVQEGSYLTEWEKYVKVDRKFFRPAEVEYHIGDSLKAKSTFDWEPKVKIEELMKMMLKADVEWLKPR